MQAQGPGLLLLAISVTLSPVRAEELKPETIQAFECYVQSAEKRMDSRQAFLLADTNAIIRQQVAQAHRVHTVPGNGPNPHKLNGGHLYDWIGTVFIEGATMERMLRFLQDYDHRPQYFP